MASFVIDCQILQTIAFDRGMGKYTSSLLQALNKNKVFTKKYTNIYLVLNKNLDTSDSKVKYINNIIPRAKIEYLDLPIDIAKDALNKNKIASKALAEYCKILKDTDITYLVTAPFFIGFTSVFPNLGYVKKYTLVYDFIPYRIWLKLK